MPTLLKLVKNYEDLFGKFRTTHAIQYPSVLKYQRQSATHLNTKMLLELRNQHTKIVYNNLQNKLYTNTHEIN